MQSKNKPSQTKAESAWVAKVKESDCIVCGAAAPSHCHEIVQGQWFTSLPLCDDCHVGPHNGIHKNRAIWKVLKLDELSALNLYLSRRFA